MNMHKAEPFPLLGFPNESNERNDMIVYRCRFTAARAIIWWDIDDTYYVNLYRLSRHDNCETDQRDRVALPQKPILVHDAFEAQLAINYLMQTHLPTEVTE
jgi:hypothetical protein